MTAVEMLTAVEGFLPENILESFYSIRIAKREITLQGDYTTNTVRLLVPYATLTGSKSGYIEGKITLNTGTENEFDILIVLT